MQKHLVATVAPVLVLLANLTGDRHPNSQPHLLLYHAAKPETHVTRERQEVVWSSAVTMHQVRMHRLARARTITTDTTGAHGDAEGHYHPDYTAAR